MRISDWSSDVCSSDLPERASPEATMILYCTLNRGTELWYLDLAGRQARPPVAPAVYALVSFEGACPRYYVGSSKRLTARLGAHLSFARSTKLRGHSAGGRLLAPVAARRRCTLV